MPILQVKDLITEFHMQDGMVCAVNGVSFDLEAGETLAIVGESGCGKSVTVMSLLGLIPQPPARVAGQALFNDGTSTIDLLKLTEAGMHDVRGKHIGMVFQDPLASLNPVLTIGLQISESLVEHLHLSAAESRERAIQLLEHVGIPAARERYNNYPHQFSGGMRQRVMFAIAIACSPKILIADEPTTALDVTVQAQIIDLAMRLQKELGMAVIWITHDLSVVAGMADRVQVMYGGSVMERALVDDLYEKPKHPYTLGLLGSLPQFSAGNAKRLVSIQGVPPNLLSAPTYCQFAERCPYAFERCWQEIPALRVVAEKHEVACFYDVDTRNPHDGD
jgi:oligopeptide/dipeptide ABC transporter ATP-binding protein